MKIKVSKLRKLIKEVISEVADYDGKYSLDDIDIGYIPPKPEHNDAEWRKRMEAKHGPNFMRKYIILGPDEKLFGKVPPPEDPEVIAQRERYEELDDNERRYKNVVTATNFDILVNSPVIRGLEGYLHDPQQKRAPFDIKQLSLKIDEKDLSSHLAFIFQANMHKPNAEEHSKKIVEVFQKFRLLNPQYKLDEAIEKVGIVGLESGNVWSIKDFLSIQKNRTAHDILESKRRRRSK